MHGVNNIKTIITEYQRRRRQQPQQHADNGLIFWIKIRKCVPF